MTVTLASPKGPWVGTAANPVTLTNVDQRRADAALVGSAGIASGLAVSVDGSDVVTVTAGQVVISGEDAVVGTGVYRAGIGASVTGSLEARDPTNARIDLVVFRQYDPSVVPAHAPNYGAAIEIIKGTPSATPAVPTRPSMAVELGRINVPATGGGAANADPSNRVYAAAVNGAGAWVNASLAVGSNFGGGYQLVQYRKVGDRVELRGVLGGLGGGLSAGVTVFTLPVGMRPTAVEQFTTLFGTTAGKVEVTTAGVVRNATAVPVGQTIVFSGLWFSTL